MPTTSSTLAQKALRVLLLVGFILTGCGGDDVAEPDSSLASLVGDWNATELTLTSVANPDLVADLIENGATFNLNVQPSGQYTAILVIALQSQTEIGQVEVDGNQITLRPTIPPGQAATTGTLTLEGNGFILEGSTEFDFNFDGTSEDAMVRFVFSAS